MPRALKLETRWQYLRRDARTLTVMLELAAKKLSEIAHGGAPDDLRGSMTCSEIREFTSECAQILDSCAVEPGRPAGRSRR
jgi:hypothetical protein